MFIWHKLYIYIYRDSHDIHIIPSGPCRATVIRDRFRSGTAPASPWRIEWREGSSRRIVPGMPRGSKGTDGNDEIAGNSLGFRSPIKSSQKDGQFWMEHDGTGTIAIFRNGRLHQILSAWGFYNVLYVFNLGTSGRPLGNLTGWGYHLRLFLMEMIYKWWMFHI